MLKIEGLKTHARNLRVAKGFINRPLKASKGRREEGKKGEGKKGEGEGEAEKKVKGKKGGVRAGEGVK